MLVLTRKIGERILVDDDIKFTVLGITGKQVKIGIDAPDEIKIHREEIYNKIKNENYIELLMHNKIEDKNEK